MEELVDLLLVLCRESPIERNTSPGVLPSLCRFNHIKWLLPCLRNKRVATVATLLMFTAPCWLHP
jgi:hypothetical protein